MNKLHPGARWLFRLRAYSSLFLVGILSAFWIVQTLQIYVSYSIIVRAMIAIILFLIFILVAAEIYARMSYTRWLYEINNEGIKIEKGIIWKKYTSIPFERVQNIDIKRGIIARMTGFSSVDIETAGRSNYGRGNTQYHGEGYLPAIEEKEAENVRIFIMKKIKQTKKTRQGL